jgi:hypothetical protein
MKAAGVAAVFGPGASGADIIAQVRSLVVAST